MGVSDFLGINAGGILWVLAIIFGAIFLLTGWFNNFIIAGMLVFFAVAMYDNATKITAVKGDRTVAWMMMGIGALALVVAINAISPSFFQNSLPFAAGAEVTPTGAELNLNEVFATVNWENSILGRIDFNVLAILGFGFLYGLSVNKKELNKLRKKVFK